MRNCETCDLPLIKHSFESYRCFNKRLFCDKQCFIKSKRHKDKFYGKDKTKHPRWKGGKNVITPCKKCGREIKHRLNKKVIFCSYFCYSKSLMGLRGENTSGWKGGRRIDKDGYVLIYSPNHPRAKNKNRVVYEHHLACERILGRYLDSHEVPHHINENKQDNRPENLYLFKNRSEHTRYHSLVRFNKISHIDKSNLFELAKATAISRNNN